MKGVPGYFFFCSLLLLILFSCNKIEEEQPPVPAWEDSGADSCTLVVTVQTQEGIYLTSSYVNLALNQDSLNKGLLVRRAVTDGVGKVKFSRLYPLKYFGNCFANIQGQTLFGSFRIAFPPSTKKDTILIVH
ncbi:MAG: hypothetical protein EOM90_05560 [Alphaproteobacteria bacterium]|nr:hypothetical protein [Alphaproteobacteria bacterium]